MSCPLPRRWFHRVVVLSTFALLAGACSTGNDQERDLGDASLSTPAPTQPPIFARQLEEPVNDEVTPTAPTTVTTAPPAPTPTLHVIGSITSLPEATPGWQAGVPVLVTDDVSIATLACDPTAENCSAAALSAWSAGAVEFVNVATASASLSAGTDEFLNAVDALQTSGLQVVGYGQDQASAIDGVLVERNNITISVHGISLTADPATSADPTRAGIAGPAAFDDLLDVVETRRGEGAAVIVIIDLGSLDDRAPTAEQVAQIQRLVEIDIDAIVGHGSDYLQRFDRVANSTVAYSLGNAVTESDDPLRADAAVLRLEFASPGRACLLPSTATDAGPALDDLDTLTCTN